MTGGAYIHIGNAVDLRRGSISRHRQRLPDRGENAPIRDATARSLQAPTLSGRPDTAWHQEELVAQRYPHSVPTTKAMPKSP